MAKLKKKAHELTADEVMKRVFHPKALPHIKAHVKKLAAKPVKK
jgi:hypothetical protein